MRFTNREIALATGDDGSTAILIIAEAYGLPVSAESRAVIQRFYDLGYLYLRLDHDGDKFEDLPVYDW